MHLIEVLKLRAVPAAGIYLSLTRRCPLSCAHCSTNSSLLTRQEPLEEDLISFVSTFKIGHPPEIMFLTGGEPLLRPRLVNHLATLARKSGTKTVLISGMFFANLSKIPQSILNAIQEVDHFIASMDIFHENQVPRDRVFSALNTIQDMDIDVSIQAVGMSAQDPYLQKLIEDVRVRFQSNVPMFITTIGPSGRAKTWFKQTNLEERSEIATPCRVATWPVVTFNGAIVACCNQEVINGAVPSHLGLGNIHDVTWDMIRRRLLGSYILRGIRTFGPQYLARNFGKGNCSGFCQTCFQLSDKLKDYEEELNKLFSRRTTQFIEQTAIEFQRQQISVALPSYDQLLYLGYPSKLEGKS